MVIETFVRVRASYGSVSLHFLIFEKNQNKAYREVLIAGDLSQEDLKQAESHVVLQVSWL